MSLLRSFTPVILGGAARCGIEPQALADVLRAGPDRVRDLLAGNSKLTEREGRALEEKTGRPVGELALLGMEAAATPEMREANAQLIRDTIEHFRTIAGLEGTPPIDQPAPPSVVRDPAA